MTSGGLFAGTDGAGLGMRDLLAIGFRHKWVVTGCFCGILLGAILAAISQSPQYRAEIKFLIERERLDPVISPGASNLATFRADVTEEELNSEIQLLESTDVLRQVAVSCGLDQRKEILASFLGREDKATQIANAVNRLQKALKIEVITKSNVISVNYASANPELSTRVLSILGDAYLKKNVEVHRPPGQVDFFNKETETYKNNLSEAEAKLKAFSSQNGGVAPQMARDIAMQKLNEFYASLHQTRAEIATIEERIRALETQSSTTPQRLITQSRQTDDAPILQGLKNTLMDLELKRTQLLTKYQPTYPLVKEIDKQIADTHSSIESEESQPIREETTDLNPTYGWINEELAKARADRSGLQARSTALQTIVTRYAADARELDERGVVQQDLLRTVKTAEENYLMYQRKLEEARMTNALDQTHILNVAIAEQPVLPVLPSNSRWTTLVLGLAFALIGGVGAAFTLEYMSSSFRTPAEMLGELNIPVLGGISLTEVGFHNDSNGNGNSRHKVKAESHVVNDEPAVRSL